MKPRSVVTYSLLRLAAFFVPFAVLMIANVPWWISALVAAVFGFAFSLIFLRAPREKVATEFYEARHREQPLVHPDDESEDAALDAVSGSEDDRGVERQA